MTADGVEQQMRSNALDATAGDLAQHVPAVRADESLEGALQQLLAHGLAGLPVLDTDDGRVIGWLTHRDVLRAYSGGGHERGGDGRRAGGIPGGGVPATGVRGVSGGGEDRSVQPDAAHRADGTSPSPRGPGPSWLQGFRILDLEFTADAAPVGTPIGELPWPSLALPIMIRRNGLRFPPTAATVLQVGDRVTVLVERELAPEFADHLLTTFASAAKVDSVEAPAAVDEG